MDSHSPSPLICKRLIKLVYSLLNRSSSPSWPHASDGSPRKLNNPNGYVGSEIEVEFRHKDIGARSSTHQMKDHGIILSKDQMGFQKGVDKKERVGDQLGGKIDKKAGKRERRDIGIEGGRGKGIKSDVNGSGKLDEAAKMSRQARDQETRLKQSRETGSPSQTLLRVASNINEKSKEFIEWKKRELSRGSSSDSAA